LLIELSAPESGKEALQKQFQFEKMPLSGGYSSNRSQQIGMAEVIMPPSSELLGKTLVEVQFRTRHGLTAIGLTLGFGFSRIKHFFKSSLLPRGARNRAAPCMWHLCGVEQPAIFGEPCLVVLSR
jgi:hypothetical protein